MAMGVVIQTEVLAAARGMSSALLGTLATVGLALWLFGWRWHRLWITAAAGLASATVAWHWSETWTSTPRVVSAVVLALAAAGIAVELVRVAVFLVGAFLTFWLIQAAAGQFHDVWLLCPLGGLLALLLFRYGWMLFTSVVGTLVTVHALLLLAENVGGMDAQVWATKYAQPLTIALGVWVLLGFILQVWMDRLATQKPQEEPPSTTHVSVLIPVEQQSTSFWKRLFAKRSQILPS